MHIPSLFSSFTGDTPLFKIIDFLVDNKGLDFTKKDIAEGADISRASLFEYWPQLERNDVVKPTRKFGKTVLYTLNNASPITKKILELEAVLIRQAMVKSKTREEFVVA
ncbi:MAG TPA: hypothetical protein VJH22_07000 [Candidatus Nanoarchaeia archaeon]|nr:hypothetical protein [Candidatus Nanoarchaeia archaeon]